jgi:hypothetical protein
MEIRDVDKYANDAAAWLLSARVSYEASRRLFETEDLLMVFPAATLGHEAIEKYLKTALICTGATICNPVEFKVLINTGKLKKNDCAWGHDIVALGEMLAARRADFNLGAVLFERYPTHEGQLTLRTALEIFDPFFDELRYPVTMENFTALGPMDVILLNSIVASLKPFAECAPVVTT